jgi:hypothetical protein
VLLSVGCRFVDWSASSWRAGVTFCHPADDGSSSSTSTSARSARTTRSPCRSWPMRARRCAIFSTRWGAASRRPTTATRSNGGARLGGAGRGQVRLRCDADDDGACRPRDPGRHAARRDRRDRRRPAAGHGQAALGDPRAADPPHLGRLLDDGVHASGGDRRPAGEARCPGAGDLRRWRLPPDHAGAASAGAMLGSPVCTVVLDNSGWISIKGGQTRTSDAPRHRLHSATASRTRRTSRPSGAPSASTPSRRHEPAAVRPAVERALASGGPSLVHVRVERDPRWPARTRPAGGTSRCRKDGRRTTSSCADAEQQHR